MPEQIHLMPHQQAALDATSNYKRCAYFHAMGLGKTYTGSEKLMSFGLQKNLIVCQLSKVSDWVEHMKRYYDVKVYDLTGTRQIRGQSPDKMFALEFERCVGVINYDRLWRRPNILNIKGMGVIFDESSMLKHEKAKRTKAVLKMDFAAVVLLSGTPMGGKYEQLLAQYKLLGWRITKQMFYDRYVIFREMPVQHFMFPVQIIVGYKHVDELKTKLRALGCQFLRTEDVIDLPEQNFQTICVPMTREYKEFVTKYIVEIDGKEMVGDNPLTRLNYCRMLCGSYNSAKLKVVEDLLESTEERMVIFYAFRRDFDELKALCDRLDKPVSVVNGDVHDLANYENKDNAVVLCQHQAAAKGLNLQKACRMIVFDPTTQGEDHMQMLKRIHRIGQTRPCFYYLLNVKGSVEEDIYRALERKEDYTLDLFKQEYPLVG